MRSFAPKILEYEAAVLMMAAVAAPRIWIGNHVVTPAHFDESSNVACVAAGKRRFTFDAAEVVDACKAIGARTIVPVHRSGWAHFRQPESELVAALDRAGLAERVRMLELG